MSGVYKHVAAPAAKAQVKSEPVIAAAIGAALATFATAIIGLIVSFGVQVSDSQKAAILTVIVAAVALVGVLGPIIAGARARARVVPFNDVVAERLPDGGPIVAGPAHPAITGTVVALPPPVGDQA